MSALPDVVIADVIVVNANVYTVDPDRPRAQALAISGEFIIKVGSNEEVRRLASRATRVIDAGGRLVVPGFNDAHVHLVMGAEELVGVDLRPSSDEGDLARRLERHAATRPAGEWITGGYWDHEAWPGKRLPTRDRLDRVTPNHPVFVKRLDGHMAVANSLAMRLAGIDDDVVVLPGGEVMRGVDGKLTGLLKDTAMELVTRAMPPPTLGAVLRRARAALAHAASLGVTTLQDITASALEFAAYRTLDEAGELTARISSIANYEAHDPGAEVTSERATPSLWLRRNGRKFFADGSMGSSTAAFFEPYTDDPGSRGLLIHEPHELEQLVGDVLDSGQQPVVHAIGDRANALVLDILERLHDRHGRAAAGRRWRPRIEHAQVVRIEDRARFKSLGVVASIQPSHCIDDMRWAEARIGRARSAQAYNVRSFVDAGVRVAFGTDWFVAPLNPMLGLYAAVTRQFPDGTPADGWWPQERIALTQAVECYTRGSAYAEFAEHHKGMLRAGYLADLVVLSHDLFAIPSREILETRPILTMAGGRVVFDAGDLEIPESMSVAAASRAQH
ncbi:MAG: amidohydrolase [Vicinamibacterales bacterium]